MPKLVIYFAAGLLLLGVLPLPYGYYTLLRLVVFGVFTWAAFIAFEKKEVVLPWVFVLLALIFNPIIKTYLPKEIWAIIDFCSGIFLIFVRNKIQEMPT
ncbi:DUF6804 family protein [Psychrobacter sp. JCM 18902]|uniref:DUF6804 family protein n=1 Tax=Psychrobacter sp. JCM 18902 TaxID=1298607 RepID=UPI0005EDA960|nr:DUF6804 family protein [Psychrobacter sp. JCM 18902]